MTPFRNDEDNPFARDTIWPAMPQTPLSVATGRATPSRYRPSPQLDIDEVMVVAAPVEPELAPAPAAVVQAPPDIEFEPPVVSRPPRAPPPRRGLRVTPLIAALVVGVGGLVTLFLLIGTGPRP